MTAATAAAAKPETAFDSKAFEGTYYLAINDDGELKIAKAWFKDRYPEVVRDPQRHPWPKITREIPIPRLHEKATVIALIRGEDRSPLEKRTRDQATGMMTSQANDPAMLLEEVRECKPVRIGDHWRGKSDEWDAFGGEIDRPTFLEALGKVCSPLAPRVHVGSIDQLKLVWI